MYKSSIDQQLIQAQQDVLRKEKIVIHLAHLKQLIEEEKKLVAELEQDLTKEEKEYKSFDTVNTRNIYLKILGEHKEKMDKEREEYLLAFWLHDEASKNLQRLIKEESVLLEVLYKLFDAEKKLDALILQKRQMLPKAKNATHQQIFNNEQTIVKLQSQVKEIEESKKAAEAALALLIPIREELAKVKKSGAISYGGRDRYSSYKKKQFIQSAKAKIENINQAMQHLEKELHDISEHFELSYSMELETFRNFIDIFLKHYIGEWGIRNKIHLSLNGLNTIISRVKATSQSLDQTMHEVQLQIVALQQSNKDLIISELP